MNTRLEWSLPLSLRGGRFAGAVLDMAVDVNPAAAVLGSGYSVVKKSHCNLATLRVSAFVPAPVLGLLLLVASLFGPTPVSLAGPDLLIITAVGPLSSQPMAGDSLRPGRLTADERNSYDAPLAKFGEQTKNLEYQFMGGVAGFLNGLGGYNNSMQKFTGFANEMSQAGKTPGQRMFERVVLENTAEPDPVPLFRERLQPHVVTYARKRYIESRGEFAMFKSGLSCNLNFASLWSDSDEASKKTGGNPLHYGLVLRDIKVADEAQRYTASDAPIDGDDLLNANKPHVLWDIAPIAAEPDGKMFAVNLDDGVAHGGILEAIDWSYYRPDFAMRLLPREGLEANGATMPTGKPVKLVTEQKRGFYRMEMDGVDPKLIRHFFTVPIYQRFNAAAELNKSFGQEKISLLNLLALADRPLVNLHYLPRTERVKSEVKTGVGSYAVSFGSDSSMRLADKDKSNKYELGLSRSF